ncbi:YlxM family DNA-binding protein [Spiroplasma turonicum]|nr:sigma factor-like helix-turn-helix DNA-binding protein [Spiroplasma turonicum]
MINNEISKTVLLTEYYDYYKNMLTEKQRQNFELYFFEDLSYQEIADNLEISKSAVHDSLNKTVNYLINIEEKLGFVKKQNMVKDLVDDYKKNIININQLIDSLENII